MTRRAAVWLPIALAAVVYLGGIGNAPFYSWREAREALVVQAEVETGEWILPLRNGVEIPTKPPLYYWLAGLAARVRGAVDPLALRLPSALLAIAGVLAVLLYGSRKWGPSAGIASALVLATSLEWLRAGTSARVDMTQAVCLTAAFLAHETATRAAKPSVLSLVVLYGGMALATLAKGPTGILLPLLVGAADLAVRRDAYVRRLHPVAGLAAAVAIPAIWYLLAAGRGGEAFLRQHFLAENLGRFFAPESFELPHVHGWYFYVPAFLGGFAPWTFFLIPLAGHLAHERRRLEAAGMLYPLIWFAVVFVFFSVARGKRPVYLLSLYPAAALLLGRWWSEAAKEPAGPLFARLLRALAALVAIAVAGFIVLLTAERFGIGVLERLHPFLKPRDRGELELIAEIVAERFPSLLLWGIAAALAAWSFARATARDARHETLVALALLVACGATLAGTFYFPALAWRRTYEPFVTAVDRTLAPGDQLYFYRSFDHGAVFYAGRHVGRLRGDPCAKLVPGRATYVLVTEKEWSRLDDAKRAPFQVLGRSDGTGPRGRDPLIFARVREDGCK